MNELDRLVVAGMVRAADLLGFPSLLASSLATVVTRGLLAVLTVGRDVAHPGDAMEGLRLRDEAAARAAGIDWACVHVPLSTRQRCLYVLLAVLRAGYAEVAEGRSAQWLARALSPLLHALALVNSLWFLWAGRYRTVAERLLGMRLMYSDLEAQSGRRLSFAYINRQIIAEGATDLIEALTPLAAWAVAALRALGPGPKSGAPETECGVCGMNPILIPARAACGHHHCYYCLSSHTENDPTFRCPKCNKRAKNI